MFKNCCRRCGDDRTYLANCRILSIIDAVSMTVSPLLGSSSAAIVLELHVNTIVVFKYGCLQAVFHCKVQNVIDASKVIFRSVEGRNQSFEVFRKLVHTRSIIRNQRNNFLFDTELDMALEEFIGQYFSCVLRDF